MREIRDAAGVEWVVFEVQLKEGQQGPGVELPEPLRHGWLCFESATEKRRLTPTPVGWSGFSAEELATLLEEASLVRRPAQRGT